jgi:hypothetical protein
VGDLSRREKKFDKAVGRLVRLPVALGPPEPLHSLSAPRTSRTTINGNTVRLCGGGLAGLHSAGSIFVYIGG